MKKAFLFILVITSVLLSAIPVSATDGTEIAPVNNTLYTILACIAIGLAAGLTVTLLMKRGMSTVRKQKRADIYVKQGSFSLTEARDIFLYSTVTRIRINNSNNRK